MKVLIACLLLVLGACAAGEPLPPITGPWMALNAGRWQPSDAELQEIRGLPEK